MNHSPAQVLCQATLSRFRKAYQLRQKEVAEALGLYEATLTDVERGRIRITAEEVRRIARAIVKLSERRAENARKSRREAEPEPLPKPAFEASPEIQEEDDFAEIFGDTEDDDLALRWRGLV